MVYSTFIFLLELVLLSTVVYILKSCILSSYHRMQLCNLDDLYNKFEFIKLLQIGNIKTPTFAYSDGFNGPGSELVFFVDAYG